MAFKIPSVPSEKAYLEELADFWEILAIRKQPNFVSIAEISSVLAYGLDELQLDGVEAEDDEIYVRVEESYGELSDRVSASGNNYPFTFKRNSIKFNGINDHTSLVYAYLLLATRLNMKKDKKHNGLDGTLLFEKLSALVSANYFNVDSAQSIVFGTAVSGGFEDKVNDLIKHLREGGAFHNPQNHTPSANDDSVDVVTWKEFADRQIGKFIAFGQCKTGTNWRNEIHKLKPRDFCETWFRDFPVFSPITVVFLADTMTKEHNFYKSQKGFLVLNRFRILEHLPPSLPQDLQDEINLWTNGALSFLEEVF